MGKYKGLSMLALLLVVLPLAVWTLALRETVGRVKKYNTEKREVEKLRDMVSTMERSDSARIGSGFGEIMSDGQFIRMITAGADHESVAIERYTPVVTQTHGDMRIISAEVMLSGGYIPLVKTIDRIERDMDACKIVSADFKSTKELRTGKIRLTATLLIQQISGDSK